MIYKKAEELLQFLAKKEKTIAFSESCTGGLVAEAITECSGASQYFLGGLVAYSNQIKNEILGVNNLTLEKFGAVSKECAYEMLQGTLKVFKSDYAISITGIAGPTGGSEEKPVGLVYIGVGSINNIEVFEFKFNGTRHDVRMQSAMNALDLLQKKILES